MTHLWHSGVVGILLAFCTSVAPAQEAAPANPAATSPPAAVPKTYSELPSEIPAKFQPVKDEWQYERREEMIPMRDGVKLHTIILVPKGAQRAPMLLTRTPYNAARMAGYADSPRLEPILQGYDNPADVIVSGGYIRVLQDVRGQYDSEGDYVVNRPLQGPLNATPVDHSTDTYDTVDWLVKNVAESNGKVGILGISYDGFLPLMAIVNPHPALKVSVPMNPMVDGWRGDDWFHHGAFRQLMMAWIYNQEASAKRDFKWWTSDYDAYDTFMAAGTAGELGRRRGMEQLGFWKKLTEHPTYDAFWQQQAMDKVLAAQQIKIPVMLVHGLWDQEDIYGAPAVYKAIEPQDQDNDRIFLVMGPWNHGQQLEDCSALGAIRFRSDTGYYFRHKILAPFLAQHLKDGAPKADIAPVMAFETGPNEWRRLNAWPAVGASEGAITKKSFYLLAGGTLADEPPSDSDQAYTEYLSDPAKPVPFQSRPIRPASGGRWSNWLVDDQREASGRPDVITFVSSPLAEPLKIAGEPSVHLVASTSGTDSDWVVKLIDVYPPEVAEDPEMGGYQLMVSADIFRGRYRESYETAKPLAANEPLDYHFTLPNAHHVFLPGHRVMVQIQSSWFPLYDRNPQTFVPNIFFAQPGDFQKATQRVYHSPAKATRIEIPAVK